MNRTLGRILDVLKSIETKPTSVGVSSRGMPAALDTAPIVSALSVLALESTLSSLNSKDFATQTTLASVLLKLSTDPSTETTSAAILAKLISAPATEAKQDSAIALLTSISMEDFATETKMVDIEDILTTINAKDFATEVTTAAVLAKLTSDPSTETTSAAILAKIISAPSTEAKQDSSITILTAIDADTSRIIADAATEAKQDDILTDTAHLSDIASNTATIVLSSADLVAGLAVDVLAVGAQVLLDGIRNSRLSEIIDGVDEVKAKIIASPATEAKQDDMESSLNSILAKIIAAPSTEATLAAILLEEQPADDGVALHTTGGAELIFIFRPTVETGVFRLPRMLIKNTAIFPQTFNLYIYDGTTKLLFTQAVAVAVGATANVVLEIDVTRNLYLRVEASVAALMEYSVAYQKVGGLGTFAVSSS